MEEHEFRKALKDTIYYIGLIKLAEWFINTLEEIHDVVIRLVNYAYKVFKIDRIVRFIRKLSGK